MQVFYHVEVFTALLYAFEEAGANATVFTKLTHLFEVATVISEWQTGAFRSHEELLPKLCDYDVVVLVTYPEQAHNWLDFKEVCATPSSCLTAASVSISRHQVFPLCLRLQTGGVLTSALC